MRKSTSLSAAAAQRELRKYADPKKAKFLLRFFKTGAGEYADGDRFMGIVVPDTRKVARQFKTLSVAEVLKLLRSKIHEDRLLALMIWVNQFGKSDAATQKKIYSAYLGNLKHINNWDLVDLSARDIVGAYLEDRDRSVLHRLGRSKILWERRVAVVATFHFLRKGDFVDILKLSRALLGDQEDLIHKATGWMLREVGKRDRAVLVSFLKENGSRMPRTMLRYSIEHFSEAERKKFLAM